jgi:hypothetical protein
VDAVDNSIPSALSVLPNVIEKSVRTVVLHGGVDFVLIAEGTRCDFVSPTVVVPWMLMWSWTPFYRIAIQYVATFIYVTWGPDGLCGECQEYDV